MSNKYYTLCVYEPQHDKWFIHFGDYELSTVTDEKQDMNYGWDGIPMKHMRIIKTPDDQNAIDAALDKLNGKA